MKKIDKATMTDDFMDLINQIVDESNAQQGVVRHSKAG